MANDVLNISDTNFNNHYWYEVHVEACDWKSHPDNFSIDIYRVFVQF